MNFRQGEDALRSMLTTHFFDSHGCPTGMVPYLNDNGALELPYLENVEIANQMQVD